MKENSDSGHVVSTREKLACLYQFFATWKGDRPADYESVLKFIRRLLKQHRLSHYQEADILHEAYRRAVNAVEKGKEIDNLPGWMRSTALNIIRELSKKEKRQKEIVEKVSYSDSFSSTSPIVKEDASINKDIERVIDAMNEWGEEDQALFYMRAVDSLSWREISLNIGKKEQTLRKRYQRLRAQTKKIFQ